MATYYSDVYVGPPARGVDTKGGVVHVVGKLTLPGGVAPVTGDVLKLARLPANCYITSFRVFHASWGTTVPCKIGTATDDDDCVIAAHPLQTACNTTGKTFRNDETAGTSTNTAAFATDSVVTTAAQDFQATLGSVTSGTAASALTFQLEYINLGVPQAGTVAFDYNGQTSL